MNESVTEQQDSRLNEHGVYVHGVHTVTIDMPPKCAARVRLVTVSGGVRIGLATQWSHAEHGFGGSSPPSVRGEVYPSRSAAIVAAAETLLAQWREKLDRCDSAAGQATLRAAVARLTEFRDFHLPYDPPTPEDPMNPGTAAPKQSGAKPRRTKTQAPTPEPAIAGDGNRIPIEQITPHPDNPRKTFDPAALERLADSIRRSDVLQPVLVRRVEPFAYQLVCGERRYRAAQLAGLVSIPAVVREMSDAEALELMIVENEEREDLNPIELALGLAALTKPLDAGGAGLTHAAAAARFSHEEAWATNLMRLLQLPDAWQQRIASGEIPQTFARAMLPYAAAPEVLAWMEEVVTGERFDEVTRDEWMRYLDQAVKDTTRPMDPRDKPYHDYTLGNKSFGRLFKLTAEQEARLGVVELPVNLGGWGNPKRETLPRATNVQLWEELQAAAKEERRAKRAARENSKTAGKPESGGKGPTPEELRRKREEQDRSLAVRAEAWLEDLTRAALAREMRGREGSWLARWFCRWYARTSSGQSFNQGAHLTQRQAMEASGHKLGADDFGEGLAWLDPDGDPLSRLETLDHEEAAIILDPDSDTRCYVVAGVLYQLVELLKVKLSDEWKACDGERLREFFRLHTLEQLRDLAHELGDHFTDKTTKATAVEMLAEAHERKPYAMPTVLKAALPASKRRKPKPR